jgi:hypothetical protein
MKRQIKTQSKKKVDLSDIFPTYVENKNVEKIKKLSKKKVDLLDIFPNYVENNLER